MREQFRALAGEAWTEYWRAEVGRFPFLARPSVPILYFGDSDRYAASDLRVVTVGKNPSDGEFKQGTFAPFYGAEPESLVVDAYLSSLDAYFSGPRARPHPWFSAFEPVLGGLEASYRDGAPNRVLHTDLCSPLATSPTWSKLEPAQQRQLESVGSALWHRLIEVLQPDIILISVRRDLLDLIHFPREADGRPLDHPVPPTVETWFGRLASGKTPLFVFAPAKRDPVGGISREVKRWIGIEAREVWMAGAASSEADRLGRPRLKRHAEPPKARTLDRGSAPPPYGSMATPMSDSSHPSRMVATNTGFPIRPSIAPIHPDARWPQTLRSPSPDERRRGVAVAYSAKNFTVYRAVVDRLAPDELFRMETDRGTYEMTRGAFLSELPNIAASRSYRAGTGSMPNACYYTVSGEPPGAVRKFRV